jgi:hypothetical protein
VEFVDSTADLYFTLNLLHATFLQVDMAGEQTNRAIAERNGTMSLQHLRKCETASARFAQHADATWTPSNEQASKMLFRQAKCLRLMRASANVVKAVTLIEQAVALAPNDLVIKDEKDAVLNWEAQIEELQRTMQPAQVEEVTERVSLWSYMRSAISELAS